MKALIVDDEKHVRDAIRLLVDWEAFGIAELAEAEDGESAAAIIANENPDFVFTDMLMPGMGGCGLLEWIKAHAPRTKTIVISGHDDFELVRTAVKCGGQDYILKPIDPAELQEAVAKAVQSRRQEEALLMQEHRRNMQVNEIKPVYWDRLLSNLIENPAYYDKIRDSLISDLGYSPECRECCCAVLSLESIPADVRRKFSLSLDLLYFSLINICNEYMAERKSGYAFRHGSGTGYIVLLFWRNGAGAHEETARIHEGIARTLKGRFDFGLGRPAPFPGQVGLAYREAVHALRSRNLLRRTGWIHPAASDMETRKPLPFREHEEHFRLAVRSTSTEQIDGAVQIWYEEVKEWSIITIEQLELWKHELSLFQARWLKETLGDSGTEAIIGTGPPAVPLGEDGMLSMEKWRESLSHQLKALAGLYKRHLHENKHVIYEIARFIQVHYQEDITLQTIADRFFLSREYISRKFKQELKENLSDYIGRIRIEKARLLLLNPDCRISWIAGQVGYQDEKYFSKVFKKITGLTPGEYRRKATSSDS